MLTPRMALFGSSLTVHMARMPFALARASPSTDLAIPALAREFECEWARLARAGEKPRHIAPPCLLLEGVEDRRAHAAVAVIAPHTDADVLRAVGPWREAGSDRSTAHDVIALVDDRQP